MAWYDPILNNTQPESNKSPTKSTEQFSQFSEISILWTKSTNDQTKHNSPNFQHYYFLEHIQQKIKVNQQQQQLLPWSLNFK